MSIPFLETVMMGNKVLFAVKSEMDALYADYDDKNADRIGELQVQFEEMNGWNAESDAGCDVIQSWNCCRYALQLNGRNGRKNESSCVIGTSAFRKS